MRYELDRTPSATNPPCFQPHKRRPHVRTVLPDVALSPDEWWHYHADRGRYMPIACEGKRSDGK
jgi:D-alanyl-D-alanine dipeptidase